MQKQVLKQPFFQTIAVQGKIGPHGQCGSKSESECDTEDDSLVKVQYDVKKHGIKYHWCTLK